ncbi:glycosyltransferase [Urechidicola vernalis]|uniref:Glycosyltransferase n=1 Tax=Urechidicola vernalis TaxID=3075600 RepID=A0ABU2Y6S5_9FLAO|nr:glycosyltransferase [Urechidicola sp. P050]MDT0553908.1 glycosyltransferase [Urechidicola sp. P050]
MQVVFVIFIAITCIQLFYFLFIFSRFSFLKPNYVKGSDTPVSVLVCARNEAKNLPQLLPQLLKQKHTNFELVLINDGSYDSTLEIFEDFQEKNIHTHAIKIVNVVENEQFWGNKKFALSLGIKAATHEQLLFTDADCVPNSEHWISEMSHHFSDSKQIVLGYGAYEKVKNSPLNKLIRFETLYTALQYFSYAKIGLPYMGVGRNLAYKKSLFFKAGGFAKHMHLKSGDDDLFVNINATTKNTALAFSTNSFTNSKPNTTFKNWIHQKRRHVSTASFYKSTHQFFLGLSYSSQLLFWSFAIFLLALQFQWKIVLGIIGFRMLVQLFIFGKTAKKLNEKDLILWIPFFELFLIVIQLFIFIKNKVSKPTHW